MREKPEAKTNGKMENARANAETKQYSRREILNGFVRGIKVGSAALVSRGVISRLADCWYGEGGCLESGYGGDAVASGIMGAHAGAMDMPEEPIDMPDEPIAMPDELMVFDGYEEPVHAMHDGMIIESVGFWNDGYKSVPGFKPLNPNLFKALVLQESGDHEDSAWLHDPAQIANEGDYALRVMRDGLEASIPDSGYSELHGITETPGKYVTRKKSSGKSKREWVWDYRSGTGRITPELSIKYGVRWMFQKGFDFGWVTYVDNGSPVLSYKVKPRDTLSDISKKCGTTEEILAEYNGIKDRNTIHAGSVLVYRKSVNMFAITGMKTWREAVGRYNGGGTEGYADGVYAKLENARPAAEARSHSGPAYSLARSASFANPFAD